MLTENDIVDAVAEHLKDRGWNVIEIAYTHQRGPDILVQRDGIYLEIEAKGGTSSKVGTNRSGLPFTSSQKYDRVAKAFYDAACIFSEGQHRPGIALPSDSRFRKLVDDIRPALERLGVWVFWVGDDRTVQEISTSN